MPAAATSPKNSTPRSLEHQLYVALQRLANDLSAETAELLKPAGLSGAQYNVLRILRGAGEEGLACGEVAERLLTRDPDMTRLLDRLATQGLVTRARERDDRRVVTSRITAEGLALLESLDAPMLALHRRQLGHLGRQRLSTLLALVQAASSRDAPG